MQWSVAMTMTMATIIIIIIIIILFYFGGCSSADYNMSIINCIAVYSI
jgi:hypothetical protein